MNPREFHNALNEGRSSGRLDSDEAIRARLDSDEARERATAEVVEELRRIQDLAKGMRVHPLLRGSTEIRLGRLIEKILDPGIRVDDDPNADTRCPMT